MAGLCAALAGELRAGLVIDARLPSGRRTARWWGEQADYPNSALRSLAWQSARMRSPASPCPWWRPWWCAQRANAAGGGLAGVEQGAECSANRLSSGMIQLKQARGDYLGWRPDTGCDRWRDRRMLAVPFQAPEAIFTGRSPGRVVPLVWASWPIVPPCPAIPDDARP